ncbi:hypothetical protein ACFL1N_07200 [Thermodesulfobacteriota bacterium]
MACNFRITIHRDDKNLHLKLKGDFDGSSAWELINNLKENCGGISKVFIDTNRLKYIHPFGKGTLQKNLSDHIGKSVRVEFIGEKAPELVLETGENTGLDAGWRHLRKTNINQVSHRGSWYNH